jgi:DHA1 family multidrug resistance protein B-like MFS transporter
MLLIICQISFYEMTLGAITRSLKGNMGIMILTSGIWTLAGQLVWPFQTLYILSLGGTYFQVGLVSSIGALSGLLPTLYGGYLADTMGRKKIVASMSFLLSFNSLIFAFARDWRWIVLGSILNSIASGLRQPSFASIIDDATDSESRAQSYALWLILPPLFGLASPYFMGLYMERNGLEAMLRLGYIVLFAASLLASALRYYMLEETLIEKQQPELNILNITKQTYTSIKETVKTLTRTLWVLGAMGFFFGLGAAIGGPFWITYATEDIIGLSLSEWGIITTANTLIGTIIGIPLARIADKRSRLVLLYPSIVLTPLAIVAFIHCVSFSQTLIVSLIITVLGSMGMSSGQALFTDQTRPENRGRINSLWSVAGTMQTFRVGVSPGSILGATGNLLGGYLYQNVSKALPLYIQSSLVALTAITALLFLKKTLNT